MCGIYSYISDKSIKIDNFIDTLQGLVHRGQDNIGISFFYNNHLYNYNAKDYVELKKLVKIKNSKCILGHTKYTTSGSKNNNVNMPILSSNKFGIYALVFNGNIPFENSKYINDTQMIIDYINNKSIEYDTFHEILIDFINKFERAYSLIIQFENIQYIVRDKYGVRPLFYNEKFYCGSESNILKNKVFEVEEGVIFSIANNQITKLYKIENKKKSCIFEYIYFMKKQSYFDNIKVEQYRKNVAKLMAQHDLKKYSSEYIVCGVPNTGNEYAYHYAKYMNLEYAEYITKNKKIQRTFILENNEMRNEHASKKYLLSDKLKGKKIILVDDSIVRGITLKNLIKKLKSLHVEEIHIKSASPPLNNKCIYGIDMPSRAELIYNNQQDLCEYFDCNSISYISVEDILNIFPNEDSKCTLCLDDKYQW
tara:strand:- start:303 stop:1571 length:1269 start_codon:yes stop_codon:yes gene_type:complete